MLACIVAFARVHLSCFSADKGRLHAPVTGQDEAITSADNVIRRSRAKFSGPNYPTASSLFPGPTCVGKSKLRKTLAGFLFD